VKATLSIPSIQLPQVPSFSISNEIPTVRVPFLSLLLEPRPLRKWFFIWGFCLYLVFCFGCFFALEQPRLNHDTFIRFGADSPTYWDGVEYRSQHSESGTVLVSFTGNLLGPVLIGTLFRTGFAVACFNIVLFFFAVEVACTIPGVDRYRLLFLLAICAETAPALVTLNKEIMVLVSALLFAKYVYSKKRSLILLAAVFVVSVFARWEQIAILLLYLFLSRKGSVFRRKPWMAVFTIIAILTVLYPLIARLPGSRIGAFTQYARGANTIAKLNKIQTDFGFPLVLVPKIIMDIFGELLRPFTFLGEYYMLGYADVHSIFIIPLFSIALITLLVKAYRRGLLHPERPIALLIITYAIVTAVTPFVQPRYYYFNYVLLCVELARYNEAERRVQLESPVTAKLA
jgi:hypothetical protein